MPAPRRIRAPPTRRVDRHIDAPERATHSTRALVHLGTAMDVSERADVAPETVSIQRWRELLGDDADALSGDDVRDIVRHADAMARILVVLALQDGRIH